MIGKFSSLRIATLVIVALPAVSCDSSPIVGPEQDLAAAQEKWRSNKPANYDMVLTRVCECLPGSVGTVAVVVRGGRVSARRYSVNGAEVSTAFADVFPHVDDLFFKVRSALWAHVNKIEVEYDATLGYPTRIYVDPLKDTADDEVLYTVAALTVK